jgi:GT2 family glycosyltransferase
MFDLLTKADVANRQANGDPARRHSPLKTKSPPSCAIVLPVYNAFPQALACVRSVIELTPGDFQLLIVDDCSPNGRFEDYLPEEFLIDPRVRLMRNNQNLGFTKSCNLGMRQAASADVVLLNSDTEVSAGWLEKMQRAAYSSPSIGTVTPLTNNGTVSSVPVFMQDNELPVGQSIASFAAMVERVSLRTYPRLPTCVGFCVYIKREVIDRVGYLDEEAFGRGYGEENDFSCRLQAAGYIDVLDDSTFIYHKGRTSFGEETDKLSAEHMKVLKRKHPRYEIRARHFVKTNPLKEIHERIHDSILRHWLGSAEFKVLHILHNRPMTSQRSSLPGGTEYHVADLIRLIPSAAHWSLYSTGSEYCLTAHVPGCELEYYISAEKLDLAALVHPAVFDVIHVHHTNKVEYATLAESLLRHGRYFVSLHDFRMCCPKINLLTPDNRLCNGHECVAACRQKQSEI